jgi:hypothetical protein
VAGEKKDPRFFFPGVFFFTVSWGWILSQYGDIGCLRTFRTVGHLEFYLIAFVKNFVTFPVDGGEVNENIIPVIPGNEPEALLLIKPFNSTFGHYNSPPSFDQFW